MEEVEAAKKRCKDVVERIQTLSPSTNITDSCKRTLFKLALSELNFLSRFSASNPITTPLSVNIGHLEAVVHVLQRPFITGVSRVCKPIRNGLHSVHVDIVCSFNKNPAWIIVSNRNPNFVSWNGCGKSKGLKLRVEQVVAAAESSTTLRPCSVILFFSNGVGGVVRDHLREEFGASELSLFDFDSCEEIEDEWINVLPRAFRQACVLEINLGYGRNAVSSSECGVKNSVVDATGSSPKEENTKVDVGGSFGSLLSGMKSCSTVEPDYLLSKGDFINFDTTALIALVSGISNGCADKLLSAPETELRHRFKGNVQFVIAQAISELQKPIHEELAGVIVGKIGMICKSVLLEFKELVSMCGGPNEKLRADQLLKHFVIVDDRPSERMMGLPTTRKLASKNKVVFGTGDHWFMLDGTLRMYERSPNRHEVGVEEQGVFWNCSSPACADDHPVARIAFV